MNPPRPKAEERPAVMVVPIPEADLGTMRVGEFNFAAVAPDRVFVDQYGQVSANYPLTDQDLSRAERVLTGEQLQAFMELRKRQQAQIMMGKNLRAL
jgi:hypothetical protein